MMEDLILRAHKIYEECTYNYTGAHPGSTRLIGEFLDLLENPETMIVKKSEYEELLRRDAFLTRLECAGVDNWEGYSSGFENEEDDE
jgi:hypothetical protein